MATTQNPISETGRLVVFRLMYVAVQSASASASCALILKGVSIPALLMLGGCEIVLPFKVHSTL